MKGTAVTVHCNRSCASVVSWGPIRTPLLGMVWSDTLSPWYSEVMWVTELMLGGIRLLRQDSLNMKSVLVPWQLSGNQKACQMSKRQVAHTAWTRLHRDMSYVSGETVGMIWNRITLFRKYKNFKIMNCLLPGNFQVCVWTKVDLSQRKTRKVKREPGRGHSCNEFGWFYLALCSSLVGQLAPHAW